MLNKSLVLIIGVILLTINSYAKEKKITPYEQWKYDMKKIEVSQEIKDYRAYHIKTINKRLKALKMMKKYEDKKSQNKIEDIKKCVNTGITKKEIYNCVPSIFKEY